MHTFIKKLLTSLRYVIIIPVIILVILFLLSILISLMKTGGLLHTLFTGQMSGSMIGDIIGVLDIILLSTVLFIFTGGIYELFIETIREVEDPDSTFDQSSVIAQEIDKLKEKIAKMIIIVLIVTVFKAILSYTITSVYDIVLISISIVALGLTMKLISNPNK